MTKRFWVAATMLGALTSRELKLYASRNLLDAHAGHYLHSLVECQTSASTINPDFRLDCDSILPNNEPDIEVDPGPRQAAVERGVEAAAARVHQRRHRPAGCVHD
ncbi:MAG: hypothetical protein WD965_10140, partial [Actinomycetota bacterium]